MGEAPEETMDPVETRGKSQKREKKAKKTKDDKNKKDKKRRKQDSSQSSSSSQSGGDRKKRKKRRRDNSEQQALMQRQLIQHQMLQQHMLQQWQAQQQAIQYQQQMQQWQYMQHMQTQAQFQQHQAVQHQMMLVQQEEERRRMDELKKKEEEDRKALEEELRRKSALTSITKVIQKVRAATPETFDDLKKELDVVFAQELRHTGTQLQQLIYEKEKALEAARKGVEKIKMTRNCQAKVQAAAFVKKPPLSAHELLGSLPQVRAPTMIPKQTVMQTLAPAFFKVPPPTPPSQHGHGSLSKPPE